MKEYVTIKECMVIFFN